MKYLNKKSLVIFLVILSVAMVGFLGFRLIMDIKERQDEMREEIKKLKEQNEKLKKTEKNEEEKEEIIEDISITVPDVSGKSLSDAIKVLQNAGFEIDDETIEIESDSIMQGKVVKTNPPVGAKRDKGTIITLYVSKSSSKFVVQNYVGKHYLEAKAALESQGITVYITFEEVTNPNAYEEGIIIKQSIKAGQKLEKGDSIELYVPDIKIEYPDFTDGTWTVEDVKSFCVQYGVTLKIKYEAHTLGEGTIFYQSREKGYMVIEGTTLTIKVSMKE